MNFIDRPVYRLIQALRTGWNRDCHVVSFERPLARALCWEESTKRVGGHTALGGEMLNDLLPGFRTLGRDGGGEKSGRLDHGPMTGDRFLNVN